MTRPSEIVLAYVDAFNRGDLDGVTRLFTPDALVWGVLGWGTLEQASLIWKELMECLEIHLEVDSIIAQENIVAVRYTERGKSVRAFRGDGPTGRSYEITAMEWFELKEGLIHRRWGARDSLSQRRQLGLPL